MTQNSKYWTERSEYLNEQLLNKADEYLPEMSQAYKQAVENIQKEINAFYGRFATNNEITYQEAKKLLTSSEIESFKMTLEEYIEKCHTLNISSQWVKELENASTAYRISRLKAIQIQMRQQVELLEAAKDKGFNSVLSAIHSEGYYKSIYQIQKAFGVGADFATLNTNKIYKVLSKPWQPDGLNFSQRIWGKDRTQLVNFIEKEFPQAIIRGDSLDKVAQQLSKSFGTSRRAAERLLLTESAYFSSFSKLETYKELGVKEYQISATLDRKTSEICRDMDGKVFNTSEYEPGFTAPPFHPWCRTCTIPYFDDEFTQDSTRTARGRDGKNYKVPGNISYKQWYDEYVLKKSDWHSTIGERIKGGILIKGVKEHLLERGEERTVTSENALAALKNPLHIGEIKYNEAGEPSIKYIGEDATVIINPNTGMIISTWKTGARVRKKYRKG